MATFSLKRFCRADGLASIEEGHLLRLLLPYRDYLARRGVVLPPAPPPGVPPGVPAGARLDLKRLLDVLVTPDGDTPPDLIEALYYIHEMSTPAGMDLLLADVDVTGCRASWFGEYHPADVAVKAWLDDPEALQRRHAELHMREYRSFLYFRSWRRPLPPYREPPPERPRAMEARLDEAFAKKNRGRAARVFAHPQGDGTVWFLVRHGDPYRREGSVGGGGEPASVAFRPLRFDVAVYDRSLGELRVHAKAPWETTLYRLEFGLCLFGDMQFFSEAPKYTLQPLREKGAASLRCGEVRGIKYVTLNEVHLLWGGKHKEVQIHRAKDVFEALSLRRTEMPRQPELVRATFAVRFADSREPRHVTIQPPNTALFAREEDAHLVDQWLLLHGFVRGPESERHDSDQADPPSLASA